MPSSADAERLRLSQVGIRRLVERDLTGFWSTLNLDRPEASRDALLRFVPVLVSQYGESSAVVAADWYDEVRAAERVPGRYRAQMMASPYEDAVEGSVRRAAGALFTESPGGGLATLLGTSGKYALAAGRETVSRSTDQDPRAAGWQRVTRPGACGFCRMLAGRGAVYKESSVHFAAHGGARGGECNCAAVPSWDSTAPEVDAAVYEASKRTTFMSPEEKARHNALIQRAIGEYA